MKAKLNSLLDDVSGRFGDNVFARNPSGLYLRRRSDPDQPDSQRQVSVRERFTLASTRWRTITQAQRDTWNRLATQVSKTGRYGEVYHPTGHRLYLAVNTTRAELGLAPLDMPPAALPNVPAVAGYAPSLVNDGGALIAVLGDDDTAFTSRVQVLATAPTSAGRSTVGESEFRLIGTRPIGAALNADIGPLYSERFGVPDVGSKVGVRIVPVEGNGFSGSAQSALVTVSD
jgi:hypothetical protein